MLQTGDHETAGLAGDFLAPAPEKSPSRQTFVSLETVIASTVSRRCTAAGHPAAIRNTARAMPISKAAIL